MRIRTTLDVRGRCLYLVEGHGDVTGVFDSLWDALAYGVRSSGTHEERLDFVRHVAAIGAVQGGMCASRMYEILIGMIGEK